MKKSLLEIKGFSMIEAAVVSAGVVITLVGFAFLTTSHVLFERRTQKIAEYSQLVGSVQSILTSMGQVSLEVSLYDRIDDALNSDFGELSNNAEGEVARLDIHPNKGAVLFVYEEGDSLDYDIDIYGLYYIPVSFNSSVWEEGTPVLLSSKVRSHSDSNIKLFDNCESPTLQALTEVSNIPGNSLDDLEDGYCTSSPKINFVVEDSLEQLVRIPLSPLYY